jgi:hypothetical protein
LAFKEYLAVLDSDLYEYAGTTKSILARIAHLIIAPPEEGPDGKPLREPDPDEGFCTASQEYLACQLGLSESKIRKAVRLFEKDGWIATTKWRDKYGDHCKYALAPGAWDRLVARKRVRDEQGEYVRERQVNMERHPREGRFTRRDDAGETRVTSGSDNSPGYLPAAHQADSAVATRPTACCAPGRLPVKKVSELDLREGEQSETKANQERVAVSSLQTGEVDQDQDQNQHQTPSTPWDDEEQPAPVNPTPRGAAPNPAEGFSPSRLPGRLSPGIAAPAAQPPIPRPPKAVCKRIGCGGPLKGNKGVCLKCGFEPLKNTPPPKKLKNEYGEEVEGLPHHFLSRDHEAVCQNPGCETTRMGSLYDSSQKYCDYAPAAKGTTV